MDANRFDDLSRSLADRLSRRSAVKHLGGSGLLAAALAGLGVSRFGAVAQVDTATCALDLVANVRLGPNQNQKFGDSDPGQMRGQLRFALGDQGRLVNGVFRLPDDTEMHAVGQVAGPSLTVRIAIPFGGTLVLVGAGAKAIRSCDGAVDGMLTGPQPGDLGDWHATAKQTGNKPATQSTTASSNPPPQAPAPIATQPPAAVVETPPPAPTAAPTEVPTEMPTQVPTAMPTVACMGESGGFCSPGIPCCTGTCQYVDILHCSPSDPFCIPQYMFVCQ
ncbi:MAG: hypothetical protein ACJ789_09320 [Thermomicrobiales bacterium]